MMRRSTGHIRSTAFIERSLRVRARLEPLLERGAGQRRVRSGQEAVVLVQLPVRVGGVAHSLDSQAVTTAGREQRRQLDQALLARTGDLGDRPVGLGSGA